MSYPTSIAKKLFDAIEECQSPIKSINRVTDLDTQLSKEIYLFTSEAGRGKYLEAAYSLSWNYFNNKCFFNVTTCELQNSFRRYVRYFNIFKKLFKTIIYLFWNTNNFLKN